MAPAHRRAHARRGLRRIGRAGAASAAPSRCSTPTCTCRAARFASRLPQALKDRIREHGMRNSHLLSIAPTGTISLAFADNASNGIEPPFSWTYTRKKRMADGSFKEYAVEDHAWRLYRHLKGDDAPLPPPSSPRWRSARRRTSEMVAAVAPYHRHRDLQDRQRAGGLSVRRFRGPVPAGLEVGPEGPGHLPAERGARRVLRSHRSRRR